MQTFALAKRRAAHAGPGEGSRVEVPVPHQNAVRGIIRAQAKLAVSSPGDVCEREADRMAEAVMRMPDADVQRQAEQPEEEEEEEPGPGVPVIMRQMPAPPPALVVKAPPQPYLSGLTADQLLKFEQFCKQTLQNLGLQKKDPAKTDTDKFKDALKSFLEAYFETPAGKKTKDFLFGRKGLPLTLMVLSQALAAMIAENTDIPSTPDIPITNDLSAKLEFEGPFDRPTMVKLSVKYTWGAPAPAPRPKPLPPYKPPLAAEALARIDRDLLRKHALERTFRDWELAGPEEEPEKKRVYQEAKLSLPDARLVAEALARQLASGAEESMLTIDLGSPVGWDARDLQALQGRLEHLVAFVVARVPPTGRMRLARFTMEGRRAIYVNLGRSP